MVLYLIEAAAQNLQSDGIQHSLEQIAQTAIANGGELIEAQVGTALQRLFVILDAPSLELAQKIFEGGNLPIAVIKEVRSIGQDVTTIKARKGKANYLVEWNLPAGLTMEAYLQRKAEKSPLYDRVPEVKFERTYVCEDLSKCLCFYDSPDRATVQQVREVVGAPIDSITPIQNLWLQEHILPRILLVSKFRSRTNARII